MLYLNPLLRHGRVTNLWLLKCKRAVTCISPPFAFQSFDLRLRVRRVCAWTSHGPRHGPKGRPYPCRHIMAPPQWSCQAPRNARRDLRPGGLRPPEWGAPPLPGTLLPGRLATLSESPDSAAPCPASITATENINHCRQPIEVTWDRLGGFLRRLGA